MVVGIASMLSIVGHPVPVLARGGPGACPGGTAPWTGTLLAPSGPVRLQSEQEITCPQPQVTVRSGAATHQQPEQAPTDGQPCTLWDVAFVAIGPLVAGRRPVSWFQYPTDPGPANRPGAVVTFNAPDDPLPDGRPVAVYHADLGTAWNSSEMMGSNSLHFQWRYDGTWAAGICQGGRWYAPTGLRCIDGPCWPVVQLTKRPPLSFVGTGSGLAAPLLDTVRREIIAEYRSGSVTSNPPPPGQVVQFPSCFSETRAVIPPSLLYSIKVPQPGGGPVLVVNYVVQATVDETWWDFAEPENPTAVTPGDVGSGACAVQHTYQHVSSDTYGSSHIHHPPPGETWTFGDEPEPDMEAVEVWHHVHFGVAAYFQQPDGTQNVVPLGAAGASDFWLAGTPEWVRVYQIEGVPFTP